MNESSEGSASDGGAHLRVNDRWLALGFAVAPLLFMLFLFVINPLYMRHFFHIETRACGLPIFIMIFLLVIVAFPSLLGSIAIFRSGREGLGSALAITVVLVLILPAALLVLLTPAALLMLLSSLDGINP